MSMLRTLFPVLCCLWLLLGTPLALAVENVVYFHNDALGSPVAATDGSGQLLWTEAYEPYGTRVLKPEGPNRLWYTGKPEEPELGLNYFGARWYEPGIGRFHSIDPVDFHEGNVQSFNRYAYANNNPYAYVDPDGNVPIPLIIWGIGAAMTAYDTHQTYQHEGAGAAAQSLAVNGVLTAAAGGLGTVLKAAHQAKRAVEAGGSVPGRMVSKIEDITKPGSKLSNIKTDVPKSEFEKNLLDNSFTKSTSKDGNVNIFTSGDKKYTTRNFSKSTDGPTAEVFRNNQPVSKIRLGGE